MNELTWTEDYVVGHRAAAQRLRAIAERMADDSERPRWTGFATMLEHDAESMELARAARLAPVVDPNFSRPNYYEYLKSKLWNARAARI